MLETEDRSYHVKSYRIDMQTEMLNLDVVHELFLTVYREITE